MNNKKWLLAASAVFFMSPAYAVDVLSFKYNDDVTIKIANVACPLKDHKDKYPWGAVAEAQQPKPATKPKWTPPENAEPTL